MCGRCMSRRLSDEYVQSYSRIDLHVVQVYLNIQVCFRAR